MPSQRRIIRLEKVHWHFSMHNKQYFFLLQKEDDSALDIQKKLKETVYVFVQI